MIHPRASRVHREECLPLRVAIISLRVANRFRSAPTSSTVFQRLSSLPHHRSEYHRSPPSNRLASRSRMLSTPSLGRADTTAPDPSGSPMYGAVRAAWSLLVTAPPERPLFPQRSWTVPPVGRFSVYHMTSLYCLSVVVEPPTICPAMYIPQCISRMSIYSPLRPCTRSYYYVPSAQNDIICYHFSPSSPGSVLRHPAGHSRFSSRSITSHINGTCIQIM